MQKPLCLYFLVFTTTLLSQTCYVLSNSAPGDKINIKTAAASSYTTPPPMPTATNTASVVGGSVSAQQKQERDSAHLSQHHHHVPGGAHSMYHAPAANAHVEHRNSYNLLSEAMSQAVTNEFSGTFSSGSADGACAADDLDCYGGNVQDRLGMEAIRTLHRQLDDDDNGNIDLSESDDFLREELKYDSGYEKRQKVFHFNDDMHISVKELWEAWLRSEVHNWTIEQTTDWLAQSVQLPQYVDLFRLHKVTGAALPRLAVNNMHYVSNVLGIKDPIHKQKIALKAMDVVLFGPPRETGTRWKDYILVTLLLSAIIGCWYAYQQNKNAKRHLRRMAQDMEGLQRAEQSLQEMQKELERARLEQENVATEKQDLERRLKEAPTLTSSNSDLEVQQLKKEIEILRSELSRAEIELVDNCWSPPPQLQSWLQYTYELENKNHLKKRIAAEKQLQLARESCEKLRKKRTSFVGAFVSTHGKSIDDVDRSIVEARNSLGEVTNELQERLHRWKQIEQCLGLNIVNNNGLPYLESVLYGGRNGIASKTSRGRITNSTDDLDDESVQGILDSYGRSSVAHGSSSTILNNNSNALRCDDSSGSDDGTTDNQSQVHFYLGATPTTPPTPAGRSFMPMEFLNHHHNSPTPIAGTATTIAASTAHQHNHVQSTQQALQAPAQLQQQQQCNFNANSQMLRSQSTDFVPMEIHHHNNSNGQIGSSGNTASLKTTALASKAAMILASGGNSAAERRKMIKQHSTASQQSTSSNSSSVHSTPAASTDANKAHMLGKWLSQDVVAQQARQRRNNFLNLETAPTAAASAVNPVLTMSVASSIDATSLDSLQLAADDASSVGSNSLKKRKRRFRLSFVSKKFGGGSNKNT